MGKKRLIPLLLAWLFLCGMAAPPITKLEPHLMVYHGIGNVSFWNFSGSVTVMLGLLFCMHIILEYAKLHTRPENDPMQSTTDSTAPAVPTARLRIKKPRAKMRVVRALTPRKADGIGVEIRMVSLSKTSGNSTPLKLPSPTPQDIPKAPKDILKPADIQFIRPSEAPREKGRLTPLAWAVLIIIALASLVAFILLM